MERKSIIFVAGFVLLAASVGHISAEIIIGGDTTGLDVQDFQGVSGAEQVTLRNSTLAITFGEKSIGRQNYGQSIEG